MISITNCTLTAGNFAQTNNKLGPFEDINEQNKQEPQLKIWDKRTNRQTDRVVYRVALQLKNIARAPTIPATF